MSPIIAWGGAIVQMILSWYCPGAYARCVRLEGTSND